MKNSVIILTSIFLCSLIFHLWVRENIKPYIEETYEKLYEEPKNLNGSSEWDFNFKLYYYPSGENTDIIKDSLDIEKDNPAFLNIEKIANYILRYTKGRIGIPNFRLLKNKSPYEQLLLIQDGKSKVWCGLFSFYYSYFLDGAGISSRYISIEKLGDINVGTHVISEIYIPDEKKWIYSDLTYNIIYAKNAGGILNLVELVSAIKSNDQNLVFMKNNLNNGLIESSIEEMDKDYIHYMKSQSEIRYFTGQQLRNNFIPFTKSKKIFETIFPSSSYYLLSKENNNGNYLLFAGTRLFMIISFLVLVFSLLYQSGIRSFFLEFAILINIK